MHSLLSDENSRDGIGTLINNCDVYGTLMELEQHIAQALEPVSDWDKGTNTDIGRDQNQH